MMNLSTYRRWRAHRAETFGPAVADPSWDMLVALFEDAQLGRATSVSSLCRAALAPMTTALRHIEALERDGLIASRPHPEDRRGRILTLTEEGRDRVGECLVRLFSGVGETISARALARKALDSAFVGLEAGA